ncbi:tetratricopeptide repeat protein [Massilia sp. CF038]|uniref:tetratricopeptide repeat protein n=1 Tax=Massilia sp. CF038 TaxID=1881045 RepID=UPI00091B94A4|nr:tetratricopeptide repeat protein [Massilia sp. CF038]SHH24738.1 Tetratricopeptide repeat-containing protein [Massilia sp. CF038]
MLKSKLTCISAVLLLCGLVAGCATPPPVESPVLSLAEMAQVGAQAEQEIGAGNRVEAVRLYVRIVKAYPDNVHAWYRLGTLYLQLGQNNAAQQSFEHVLRLDPGMTKAHANLALAHLTQFRSAANQAVLSPQVAAENKAALQSLLRDVEQAMPSPAPALSSSAGRPQ